jgi:hypothetical protein
MRALQAVDLGEWQEGFQDLILERGDLSPLLVRRKAPPN